MSEARVMEILGLCDAYLEGHFRYTSGRHGSVYFEKIRIAQRPELVSDLGRMMAEEFSSMSESIDIVCSPAFGAIVFGFATALEMRKPFAFLQRDQDGRMTVRQGFTMLESGSRVLLVEDVATTGGSIAESMDALRARGAVIAGVGILVDRTADGFDPGVPCRALLRAAAESWPEAECPLCRQGIPLSTPGSSGKRTGPA